ncbi:MAG: hypothetical protein AAGF59_12990 [Pseudomonadota bacterium]
MFGETAVPEQLLFAFPPRAALGRKDFLVGRSNRAAIDLIDSWPDWPEPIRLIVGETGSGKSHLMAIWSSGSDALVTGERFLTAEVLAAMEAGRPVGLELGDAPNLDERGLFHVLNTARQTQGGLLLTARHDVARWPVTLPDLRSRLRAVAPVRVGAPEEALLRKLMIKLFADRQTNVDLAVIDYALLRLDRSFAAVSRFVQLCDEGALRSGRGITRYVAADALKALARDGPERRHAS